MSKISCDICKDLIPLVKDGVASKDSEKSVIEHIGKCEYCKKEYKAISTVTDNEVDDDKIIKSIKRDLDGYWKKLVFVVLLTVLGVVLTYTSYAYANILIMPIIGIICYLLIKEKSKYLVISTFIFSYLYQLILYLFKFAEDINSLGIYNIFALFISPILLSVIYTILNGVGILIGKFYYKAFAKEKKYEEK